MKYPPKSEIEAFEQPLANLSLDQKHRLCRSALNEIANDTKILREKLTELEYVFTCWHILWVKYEKELAKDKVVKVVEGKSTINLSRLTRADKFHLMEKLKLFLTERE
jgi:hypothetical protein